MPRKPKTPTPDSEPAAEEPPAEEVPDAPEGPTEVQLQQAGRRLHADHQRLKIAFADAYVEITTLREQNARLNEIIQEQQRVVREMEAKLSKDKPKS